MRTRLITAIIILISINLWAQKRPMTVEDSKTWNRISNTIISSNGEYVAYKIAPNKGDGNLFLYKSKTESTIQFERGTNAKLAYNNKLLIFKINPQADSLRQKKLDKIKKDKLPKDSLGIYLIDRDTLIKVEKIKHYYLPKNNSNWVAYLYDYKEPIDTTEIKKDSLENKTDSLKSEKKEFKQEGHRLVLLNTQNLEKYIYDNISDVAYSKNGTVFAFIRQIKDSIDSTRIFIFNTKLAKENLIFSKAGKSQKINTNKIGNHITFLYSSDTTKVKKYSLWFYDTKEKYPRILLDTVSIKYKKEWGVSENQKPYFSESGQRLYFGVAPFPKPEPKDTLLEDEKIKIDIWSWTDKRLQPQQLKELKDDLKRSYKTFYDFKTKQFIQLEDSISYTPINTKIDPIYYLSKSNDKYQRMTSWDMDNPTDYYLIDAKTGKKKQLAEAKIWRTYLSPEGKYTLAWDMQTELWNIINNKTLKSTILTENIDDIFYNDQHSTPSLRNSQRIAGWSEDEKWVYIYSQYDIWQFDVSGKQKARNLTNANKKEKVEYNFQKLDYESAYLPSDEWMIHSFSHITMAEGYETLNLKTLERKILIEENKAFRPPIKAEKADKIIWVNSDFIQFPNLKISNLDYTNIKTISNANPQQKNINWGKINLINWTSLNGDSLRGLFIVPEDFDPNKKYPVIVYFYEKYTDRLNVYWTPRPSHSTINFPYYASNGYIIFVPDINYGTGLPGKDAYNAIISGTQHISQFPFVDTKRIGIQGQSWGGYQVAYLITQTNLYACAMSGAPVSNMTSAYGGIRWNSGMSRMFQYEHGQSRIGGTLWDSRNKYIENSPIFFVDRVETPVLIMHNDGDGAVPWYQGIEYFVALRRLDKPAWLLNYNGDAHNLMKWPNRVDLTIRMFDFFEYYLKDKPIPKWMDKGLPATKKGKELRY